jgi:2-oxoglutarate ferredoxin oxidoreductase subunit gamma
MAMEFRTIFAGFGGQGIVSMGKMLAHAAMHHGKNVTFYPSYGIAMRGGTANCCVTVSDDDIASPIFNNPNVLGALNEQSFDYFLEHLEPGGVLLVNSTLVKKKAERTGITAHYVPVSEIAEELGDGRMANMAMIGATVKATQMLPLNVVLDVIASNFSGKFKALIDQNQKAMQRGYDAVK